jgi:hypothetical protein
VNSTRWRKSRSAYLAFRFDRHALSDGLDTAGGCRVPRQGPPTTRGRDGRLGVGAGRAVAPSPRAIPVGPLLCVIHGPTRGRAWSQTGARAELRRLAASAGARRRFAPHQLRHAHAVGDGPRRGAATGHPTSARSRAPRGDQHIPAGHRHHRDHQRDPRKTSGADSRERRPPRPDHTTSGPRPRQRKHPAFRGSI